MTTFDDVLIIPVIIFYSMLVFHGYIKELKKNFVDSGSVRENDENNETKFSQACVYFQPTAPEQELTQAPQCIIECNKKDRMPTCVSPVIMVWMLCNYYEMF